MARSPRHLTEASDNNLLHRLGAQTPFQMIRQLQQNVYDTTQSIAQAGAGDDFRVHPIVARREGYLLDMVQALDNRVDIGPEGQGTCQCEVCNKTFDNEAALREHRAKMHSMDRVQAASTEFDRQIHGTDGMPKCSGCGHAFERWADLQKHIEENHCQGRRSEEAPAIRSTQDMVKSEEIHIADICRDGLTDGLRQKLQQHCSKCRQWFPNDRYVKQHWTRVHKSETQLYLAEAKRWRRSQFGPIKDVCTWCQGVLVPRTDHRDTCPVLFQLSMIWARNRVPYAGAQVPALCDSAVTARGLRKHMDQKHHALWHKARPLLDKLCSFWSVGLLSKHCQFCSGKYDKRYVYALSCHAITQTALERVRRLVLPQEGENRHGSRNGSGGSSCRRFSAQWEWREKERQQQNWKRQTPDRTNSIVPTAKAAQESP